MFDEPALDIRESWYLEMLGTHFCCCCLGLRLSRVEGLGSLGSNPWAQAAFPVEAAARDVCWAQVPSPCLTVRLLRGDREGWEPGWNG